MLDFRERGWGIAGRDVESDDLVAASEGGRGCMCA
jgi:hypothetical protein